MGWGNVALPSLSAAMRFYAVFYMRRIFINTPFTVSVQPTLLDHRVPAYSPTAALTAAKALYPHLAVHLAVQEV